MGVTMPVAVIYPVMQLQWHHGASPQDFALMNSSIGRFFHLKNVLNARSSQTWKIYRVAFTFSANRRTPLCVLSLRVSRA